jgi:hypothetical protein
MPDKEILFLQRQTTAMGIMPHTDVPQAMVGLDRYSILPQLPNISF